MTGAGALAIVAACAELGAPAAFQRFVDHQVQCAARLDEGLADEREQVATRLQRRPARAVEHLVDGAEMGVLLMASVPQRRRDGSAASCAQRAPQSRQHFLPGRAVNKQRNGSSRVILGAAHGLRVLLSKIEVWRLLS
jgi:hypothetical protein